MSIRKGLNRKFRERDLVAWQKAADTETGGNLNRWIEERLNQRTTPIRDILRRIERKLDEVLGSYVDWEE